MKTILLIVALFSLSALAQEAPIEIIVQSADIEKCSSTLIPCKDQLYLSDRIESLSIDYSELDQKTLKRIKLNEEQDIPVIVKGYIVEGKCNTCLGGKGEFFKLESVEFLPERISIRGKNEDRKAWDGKIEIDLDHLNPFKQRGPFKANKQ